MSEENKIVIQQLKDSFTNGDTEFLSTCLSENSKWTIIGISTIIGKENIMRSLGKDELQELPVVTVNNIVAEGDSVVVESTGRATRKTGQPYTATYCDVYRLEDGKIRELTTYVIERE